MVETIESSQESNSESKIVDLSDAQKGDTVHLGTYEQDNDENTIDESIEWIVLDKEEDGTLLLLSKSVLDAKPYHAMGESITWEECTLRDWLNNEEDQSSFYNQVFSDEEKGMIQKNTVVNKYNETYGAVEGNDTQDKVFLLSIDETEKYFENNGARICQPTPYAVGNGVYTNDTFNSSPWLLRSLDDNSIDAQRVFGDGEIGIYSSFDEGLDEDFINAINEGACCFTRSLRNDNDYSCDNYSFDGNVDNYGVGVRPALRVNP